MSKTLKAAVKAELIPRRGSIITLLCMFAAMPIIYLLDITDMPDYSKFNYNSLALDILIFFIALIFEAYLCVRLFKDCHSGENADVALSLPVSAKERFITKAIICAAATVIPYMICVSLILIISVLTYVYHGWGLGGLILPWLAVTFEGLVMLICVMGLSFICAALSSSSQAALASSVISVLAATLLPLATYSALMSCAHIDTQERLPDILGCFGFCGVYLIITGGESAGAGFYIAGVINILISAALIFLALPLYRKRDRKTISQNPYTKVFMFIFMLICTAAVSVVLLIGGGFIAMSVAVIAGGAIYLLILNKSGIRIKAALRPVAGLLAAGAAFIILAGVMINTEGFHMSKLPQGASEGKAYAFEVETIHYRDMVGRKVKYYYNKNATTSQLEKAHSILKSYEEKAVKKQTAADFIIKGLNTSNERGGIIIYATTYTDKDEVAGTMTRSIYVINESDYDELIEALYDIG